MKYIIFVSYKGHVAKKLKQRVEKVLLHKDILYFT